MEAKSRHFKTLSGILAVVLAVLLIAGIRIPALAAAEYPSVIKQEAVSGDYTGKVVILHSNDVHGAIDGYAKIAALRDTYEGMGAEVILVDAGDFSQGDPYVNNSKGLDAVRLMNAASYQFVALGNHEFDYGVDVLLSNLKEATFKILCANVLKDGQPLYDGKTIYHAKNGIDIGLFGLDTPETLSKANPRFTVGMTIAEGQEMDAFARQLATQLKQEGVETVIAMTHLGVDVESQENDNSSIDLYRNTEGIDLIIDAHSHTVMTSGQNGEPIQSTGTKFANIGVVVIDAQGKVEDHYLVSTEALASDEKVAALAQAIKDKVDAVYGEVVGTSEVELTGAREDNRAKESNNGDFHTDALVWYAKQHQYIPEDFTGPVISIVNGGSIRAGIAVGDVTKKDLLSVQPFGNTVQIIYLTGAELLEVLEASTFCTPETLGAYPQTKGICFTINLSKTYDAGENYPNSTYHKPASIQRISIQSVDGQPFDPNATIALVTSDFIGSGGDTYSILKDKEKIETGVRLDDVLVAYLQEGLGGTIPASIYGSARGDQKQITEEEPQPVIEPETIVDPKPAENPKPDVVLKPAKDVPLTGDKENAAFWIVLALLSVTGGAIVVAKRKGGQ